MSNDPEFWRQPTDPKHLTEGWYVVVERFEHGPGGDLGDEIAPYVIGPYNTKDEAQAECESDSGVAYCLLTIDAKAENYIATDCYWTDRPPTVCVQLLPAPTHETEALQ